jgi:hypothetical protein
VLDAIPPLVKDFGALVKTWSEEGVAMRAENLAANAERRHPETHWIIIPLWLAGLSLLAIAVALFLGR